MTRIAARYMAQCCGTAFALLCAGNLGAAEVQVYEGYFWSGKERREFREQCITGPRWWLSGRVEPIIAWNCARQAQLCGEFGPVFVRLRGELSEPRPSGHLGAYSRELEVTEVLEVRTLESDEYTPCGVGAKRRGQG